MNILFDHQIFSNQAYGGISRYFLELRNNLSVIAPGDQVVISAPLHKNEYLAEFEHKGLKIPSVFGSSFTAKAVNNLLGSISKFVGKQPDIFHETYYSKFDNAPRKSKRILTVFDMIHEKYPEYLPKSNKVSIAKKIAVQRADHVICISESTRKDLIEILGTPESKISVVYLGQSFKPTGVQARTSNIIDSPYILYVGHRAGYKNFQGLVSAYCRSKEIHSAFKLVCFGGNKMDNSELSMLRDYHIPVSSVIHMSGSDQLLAALYENASAFAYPSLYEGFGIPPLEAMHFNCPVVCSGTSSLPEVCGNAAVYFDPQNIDDFIASLKSVLFDEHLSDQLRSAGRRQLEKFSWMDCAIQTRAIYEEQLG